MIDAWLGLPLAWMFATIAGFYALVAALLFWLCFSRRTRQWMLSFNGAVAELFSAIMVIFGILIGFVASDVWDRDRRAGAAVEREGASLSSLSELATAGAVQGDGIRQAIRAYVSAVAEKEWPSMANDGAASIEAQDALGALLRAVTTASQHAEGDPNAKFDNMLLDTAAKVQAARAERLVLGANTSEGVKWACVLILAFTGQITIAMLHLDRPRPHLAAMIIFTSSIVLIMALIAANEGPFQPPLYVTSEPITRVLKFLPEGGAPAPEASANARPAPEKSP